MSKTLKYLPEGQDFGAQHFTRAEAFRKTSPFCEGGMAKRYATGGKIQSRKAPPAAPPPPADWGDGDMAPAPKRLNNSPIMNERERGLSNIESKDPVAVEQGIRELNRTAPANRDDNRKLPNGGFAKGGKVKKSPGYARGGALSMQQQPMAAPAPMAAAAPAPAMGGGNPISDMVNGPLAGIGAQMQPGSPLHKAVTKIGQDAAKKIVKHITGAKGGKGTHGGKRAPMPVRRAEGGAVTGYAEGGDVAQDRGMVKSGVRQHESNMHAGKTPTALKLADGGPINRQPQDPRGRTTRHNGTPGGEVPYGVQPSHETHNAPFHGLRDGGSVRR